MDLVQPIDFPCGAIEEDAAPWNFATPNIDPWLEDMSEAGGRRANLRPE